MTPERFRLVGWIVSGLCLLLAAGLIVGRHGALVAAVRDEAHAGADLQKARDDYEAVTRRPNDRRFACAPRTEDEETAFLLDLRKRAHLCGVSISRWTSQTKDYKKGEANATLDAAAQDALEGVTRVNCDLILTGSYAALRTFLADLWTSDRLLTVSHVDWNRTDKGSELNLSLGRYLAPKPAAPTATPPATATKP